MNSDSNVALLRSLLERLAADVNGSALEHLVSRSERRALEWAVDKLSPTPATTTPTEAQPPLAPNGRTKFKLDQTCFGASPHEPSHVLCLDFGTAKSKAFAATRDPESPKLSELALGRRDDPGGSAVYPVYSSIWIADDGSMYAGSQAYKLGNAYNARDGRQRLDSLKEEISQLADPQVGLATRLRQEINPTPINLTFDDALTFYLSYLTDLACNEMERKELPRYTKRRFALPCWNPAQRIWASELLARRLLRAQVLADTFKGHWSEGIPAEEFKRLSEEAASREDEILWLLDRKDENENTSHDPAGRWGGVLEPVAAGSGRIWQDHWNDESVVLVIDVGAGTTDFSLIWSVQRQPESRHSGYLIAPEADVIRMAGNTVDACLKKEILFRASVEGGSEFHRRASTSIDRVLRDRKEQLFKTGSATFTLPNDEDVKITKDDFLQLDGITNFQESLRRRLNEFLARVDQSWANAAMKRNGVLVVVTGGGNELPMITALAAGPFCIGGKSVSARQAPKLPAIVSEFEQAFAEEYPQLAVALGGALPQLLTEGPPQRVWHGGSSTPGPLERFTVTGQ